MRPPATSPDARAGVGQAASMKRWAVSVGTRRDWNGGRRGREEFTTSVPKFLFERGKFKPIEHSAGYEEDVGAGRDQGLVAAIKLPQATFGAGAGDGVAHGGARGDHAKAGGCGGGERNHRFAFSLCRGALPLGQSSHIPKHKSTAIEAAPFGADVLKIQRSTQVLVGAEPHDAGAQSQELRPVNGREGRDGRVEDELNVRRRRLDDGEAFAALGATGCEDLAAATSGFAGAIADLAGAFQFVRAEGG